MARKNAAQCGTYSGYQAHHRRGEEACADCTAANSARSSVANHRYAPPIPCGSLAAYRRHTYKGEPIDEECRLAYNDYQSRARQQSAVRQLQPCGTVAAYRRHLNKKEEPCDACRVGMSLARSHTSQQERVTCGTVPGYRKHLRRSEPACPECLEAKRQHSGTHRYPAEKEEPARRVAPKPVRLTGDLLRGQAARMDAAGRTLAQIADALGLSTEGARGAVQQGRRILLAQRRTAVA